MSKKDSPLESVIERFGIWWPDVEPANLEKAARAWDQMAADIDAITQTGFGAVQSLRGHEHGKAVDQFSALWSKYGAGEQAYLPKLAAGCRQAAYMLRTYAYEIEVAKRKVQGIASRLLFTLAAGTALAIATAGLLSGAVAVATAGFIAEAAAVGVELSATVASVLAWGTMGALFGALEAMAVDIAVVQPHRVWLEDEGGFSLDEVTDSALPGAIGGGVLSAAGGGLRTLRAIRSLEAGDLTAINALDALHVGNCTSCAVATERTLAGKPTLAAPIQGQYVLGDLEALYSRYFFPAPGKADEFIAHQFGRWGKGARGIVYEPPGVPGAPGHVLNVVGDGNGVVRFLDRGVEVSLKPDVAYEYMVTHIPGSHYG